MSSLRFGTLLLGVLVGSGVLAGCGKPLSLHATWRTQGVTTLGGLINVKQEMTLFVDGTVTVRFQGAMGSTTGTREGCIVSVEGTGMTWGSSSTTAGTGTITFNGTTTATSQITGCPNAADNQNVMNDPNQVSLVSLIVGTHNFTLANTGLSITYSNPGMTTVMYQEVITTR